MQTKVFELHAVAFLVFLTLQPEIGRALPFRYSFYTYKARRASPISTSTSTTSTSTSTLFWMYLPYLTLPYTIPPLER